MMNRVIKFRAWDKPNKRMVESDELVFWSGCCYLNPSKSLNNPDKPHSSAKLKGHSILEEFVMQFTGLKDKNGKEIYEGDIMRFTELTNELKERIKVAFVKWGSWSYVLHTTYKDTTHYFTRFDVLCASKCEIIGNIHENPELLK